LLNTCSQITKNVIALTPNGICQVSNLTLNSVFIRCMKKIDFPDYWIMDVYNTTGLSLEGVMTKKIWSRTSGT